MPKNNRPGPRPAQSAQAAKQFAPVAAALVCGLAATFILLLIFSWLFTKTQIPAWWAVPLATAAVCVGCFVSAHVLAQKIKKIIETNYAHSYLGLYYISDQVKVSTTYVSKVFKEEYGIGVVEYMNRLRIDGAKKLLETQDLTIREIAERVGFTSDIHFIRIFKKYENTTPGVYQKQGR